MSNTSMTRADILDAARQAVTQDRAATHGKPENTFGLIAQLWSARLGQSISPAQVTIMLIDLKTSRAWGNIAHMDNWVDIAGYAACGAELAGDEGRMIASIVAARGYTVAETEAILADVRGKRGEPISRHDLAARVNARAVRIEDANAREDGETRTASMDEIKAMIASGEVNPPSPDAPEEDMPEGFWDEAVLMPPIFRNDGKVALTAEQQDIVFHAGGIGPDSPAWMLFAMHCGWQITETTPVELIHEERELHRPLEGPRSWFEAAKELEVNWQDLVDFLLGQYASGADPLAPADQKPCFYCGAHPHSVIGLYADMPICGDCLAKAKDAPTARAMKVTALAARVEMRNAKEAPDQSPVAVVDFAEEATAEALAQTAEPEAKAPSPAPEAGKRHHASKWTPEMDTKLIGGIAVRVANGMSRAAAAKEVAHEIGMGEKACIVRQQNQLLPRVIEAIDLAKKAKGIATDLAKTVAPAKPAPKPAAQPLSKRLSTPPHVVLNIDAHLTECRAKGWEIADDLRLFELVIENGFGMGDVALDMGRDSKEIKDRYDLLTGIYRDANDKWCRKYGRDDVLAALRKVAGVTGGADK